MSTKSTNQTGQPSSALACSVANLCDFVEEFGHLWDEERVKQVEVAADHLSESEKLLASIRSQLNRWADESRRGGWSTHQVDPQRELAAMNTWIESSCCHCGTANLIDNGDCQDLSAFDVEGFVCWKCDTNNEFDDCGQAIASQEDQIDQGYPVPQSPDPTKAFPVGT